MNSDTNNTTSKPASTAKPAGSEKPGVLYGGSPAVSNDIIEDFMTEEEYGSADGVNED